MARNGYHPVAQVLSPDDTPAEVREKIADYAAAGTPVVVIIDPEARRAIVHRPTAAPITLTSDDTIDLDEVVAGFTRHLREVLE